MTGPPTGRQCSERTRTKIYQSIKHSMLKFISITAKKIILFKIILIEKLYIIEQYSTNLCQIVKKPTLSM